LNPIIIKLCVSFRVYVPLVVAGAVTRALMVIIVRLAVACLTEDRVVVVVVVWRRRRRRRRRSRSSSPYPKKRHLDKDT
jgi:hypothetical protein